MRVKKSEIVKALEIARNFTGKSKNLKIVNLVLLDAPGQKIMATDLDTFCEVDCAFTRYSKMVEKKANLVPVPGQEFTDELDQLTIAQLTSLSEYAGLPVASKAKKKELVEALFTASAESANKENASKTAEKVSVDESFCVDPKLLLGIIKSLEEKDDDLIDIHVTEFTQSLSAELTPASISIGANFEMLPVIGPEEFPGKPIYSNRQDIGKFNPTTMAWVASATSRDADEKRFHMLCVHVAANGLLNGTDGTRLHTAPGDFYGFTGNLPAIPLRKICKLAKGNPVESWITGENVKQFGCSPLSGVTIHSRLDAVEGEYPNVSGILDRAVEHTVSVKGTDLMPAIRQAALLTTSDHPGASVTFNGAIDVLVENAETGIYRRVSVPMSGHVDPPVPMMLNVGYLIDAISGTGEKTTFGLTEPSYPLHVKSDDGKHAVVMPMRL